MTEQVLIQQLSQMPEGMKKELFVFVKYLIFKYKTPPPAAVVAKANGKNGKKPLKAGFLKGTFILADDFDAPLEDFKDYMP